MAYSRDQLVSLVQDYAYGAGIDPAIAVAQAQRESGFNPNAVGSSGERGLMQIMLATWARFGVGDFDNAFDPDANLTAWGEYMKYLLNLFDWDMAKALIAYNGGEGHLLNPGKYGGPSQRAQTYASEILAQSGAGGDINTVAGNQPQSESHLLTYGLIGLVILGVILLVSRN